MEAAKLAERLTGRLTGRPDRPVVFQTGFGASGLPHIGTFAEVARTMMVRRAFEHLCPGRLTRLLCFSDDMDGLRKVPDNMPQREVLQAHLGRPLSAIPDVFASGAASFADYNNRRLRAFLTTFDFACEFVSATESYQSGIFDILLRRVLAQHDEIAAIIARGLSPERAKTYSPFLPLCPRSGRVMIAEVLSCDPAAGTINWRHPETGEEVKNHPVTGGRCKLQWKADWAMRWLAFGVDYEMAGKDLRDSLAVSGAVARALGGEAPVSLCYELFLDEQGEKISKSRGNGLSVEDWLKYAPYQSLGRFMFRQPLRAQKLSLRVIPRETDAWLQERALWQTQNPQERLGNPLWFMGGDSEGGAVPVSFAQLLNLAAAAHAPDKSVLWGFLRRLAPDADPATHPLLDAMLGCALAYYNDQIKPSLRPRAASGQERAALTDLAARLEALGEKAAAEEIQSEVYETGKAHGYDKDLRSWFRALYQILLGVDEGARFGSFVALYGVGNVCALIVNALEKRA